ncbi:MAG: tetratricopeptide repeat protein [Elusimicrobia bacterium]|nr:tetratricopeptide repeat protein [Elusimicrobiota bacterium]
MGIKILLRVPFPSWISQKWFRWLILLVVACVTFITFIPALQNEFVNWDDDANFVNNLNYRGLGWPQLKWMFTTFHLGHYQPLSWMTLGFDYLLWGMNPFGYHLTNLFLHTVNAVLFCLLAVQFLQITTPNSYKKEDIGIFICAGLAALFFSIHPLRVESVVWATQRRSVLSGFFLLLTVLCYLAAYKKAAQGEASCRMWFQISVGAYVFSLLSGGIGASLPAILLILDVYPLKRLKGAPRQWFDQQARRVWLEKIPFFILAVTAGLIAVYAQSHAGAALSLERYGVLERIAQALFGLAFYIWKTILPFRLIPFYQLPPHIDIFTWPFFLAFFTVLIISVIFMLLRYRWPAGLVAWLCYATFLFPVLGSFQSGMQLTADRYTYLSCLGWAILLAGGLLSLWRGRQDNHISGPLFIFVKGIVAASIVIFFTLTHAQALIWRDSFTLWSHVLAIDPECVRAHINLGGVLMARNQIDGAISHYNEALWTIPERAEIYSDQRFEAYFKRGVAYLKQNQDNKALEDLGRAVLLKPDYALAYLNLGVGYMRQSEWNKAIENFDKIISLEPDFFAGYYNLAVVYAKMGHYDKAIANFDKAILLDPNYSLAYKSRGIAFARNKQWDKAVGDFDKALLLMPGFVNVYYERGLCYGEMGQYDNAIKDFNNAILMVPNYALAYNNRGDIYHVKGQRDEARRDYQTACSLGFAVACKNLKKFNMSSFHAP